MSHAQQKLEKRERLRRNQVTRSERVDLRRDLLGEVDKPWVRSAAIMLAKGATADEVAEACGCHIAAIQELRALAAFQNLVVAYMGNEGAKAAEKMFRSMVPEVMLRLFHISTSSTDKDALAASKEILDRAFGKTLAGVPAVMETEIDADNLDEKEAQFEQDIEALEQKLARFEPAKTI